MSPSSHMKMSQLKSPLQTSYRCSWLNHMEPSLSTVSPLSIPDHGNPIIIQTAPVNNLLVPPFLGPYTTLMYASEMVQDKRLSRSMKVVGTTSCWSCHGGPAFLDLSCRELFDPILSQTQTTNSRRSKYLTLKKLGLRRSHEGLMVETNFLRGRYRL